MVDTPILFLGAGQANVVVDLPLSCIDTAPPALHSGHSTSHRAALRIRNAAHKECPECCRGLAPYAGTRHTIPLSPALYAAIERVVPAKFQRLIKGATEATIVPNFTSDPAQLLRLDLTAGEALNRVADYTVEVKPKSAWQQPEVIGIVVDGVAHYLSEAKHHHCRYKQMLSFKAVRDAAKGEARAPAAAGPPYCPNYLYRSGFSSREGLERLLSNAQNNLKVVSQHSSRNAGTSPSLGGDPPSLTRDEVHGIADALDASGVLGPLSHLQLCGCAPPTAEDAATDAATRSVPVLDIELLYPWSLATDMDAVEWIVLPSNPDALCSCAAPPAHGCGPTPRETEAAQRVRPLLDLQTCVERFYTATTARDVSLMIAVAARRGEPDTSSPCVCVSGVPDDVGGVFVQRGVDVYRVGAVDLDDKKHKTLRHYYDHDQAILQAFAEGEEQR